MHRPSDVIRTKTKIRVELQTTDGAVLDGFVFLGGQERVLDLLNNKGTFLPFQLSDGRFVMINRQAVSNVWPDDAEWMGDTYMSPPVDSAPFRRVAR